MKIARVQFPDGKIGKFEVPDDYTEEQAQKEIEAHVYASQKPPEPTWLEKTGSNIGNIYGGVARGALGLPLNWMPETSSKIDKGFLQKLGVNTESTPFHVGKAVGEAIPSMAVLRGAGLLAKGLGATPELVKGITSSGFEGGKTVKGLSDLVGNAFRAGALGAGTGVLTQGALHPDSTANDYALSGGIGGGFPVLGGAIGGIARFGTDLASGITPKIQAKNILTETLGNKLDVSKQALSDIPENTNLTTGQALYGIADPRIHALEKAGYKINPVPYSEKEMAKRQELVNANKAVTPDFESAIAQEANVNSAREQELNALQTAKEQNLAERIRPFIQGTAKETPQMPLGEKIVERRGVLKSEAQKPFIEKYNALFKEHPESFSLSPVYNAAGDVLSDLRTQLNPSLADRVISKAETIFGPSENTLKREPKILPKGNVYTTTGKPSIEKQGNLSDMHDLLSEIKSAIRKLGNNDTYAKERANLSRLQQGVENSINEGLPTEALSKYKGLSDEYRQKVAEPFYEGIPLDIARKNVTNKSPIIKPSDITSKFLTEEGASQFNKTFGKDPESIQLLSKGIEQQMMSASNPDKFLQDNRLALKAFNIPELVPRLKNLAEQIKAHNVEQKTLESQRNSISDLLTAESEQAASPANQARILREGIQTAFPNIKSNDLNKLKEESFLNFMRKNEGNINNKLTVGQQRSLNEINSNILNAQDMARKADINMPLVSEIIKNNTITKKLPNLLNSKVSAINQGIGMVENKSISALEKEISQAMADPQYALKLFNYLPADQRPGFLKALRASGPTLSRVAIGLTGNRQQ